MSAADNGGPAFPDPGRAQSAKQRESLTDTGMTLRDYFAAKMAAQIDADTNYSLSQICETLGISSAEYEQLVHMPQFVALMAYRYADAMLKAREQ